MLNFSHYIIIRLELFYLNHVLIFLSLCSEALLLPGLPVFSLKSILSDVNVAILFQFLILWLQFLCSYVLAVPRCTRLDFNSVWHTSLFNKQVWCIIIFIFINDILCLSFYYAFMCYSFCLEWYILSPFFLNAFLLSIRFEAINYIHFDC